MPVGEDESDVSEHSFITAFANSSYKFVKRLSKQERREWGYSSMWRIISVQGSKDPKAHHAAFPIELPWRCVKMHSDKGGLVLEPFNGSGTTMIACEQLERRCFAMELLPEYCDIAVKRFRAFAPNAEIYLERNGERIPFVETGVSA